MIEISSSAFDILWDDRGGAPLPPPLSVPSVGATEGERAEIRSRVYDNLAGRGLFNGRLDPVLAERLETLAAADVYVECEGLVDGVLLRAVAAAGGKRGVLAAQPSRTIGLSPIRPTEVFGAVVDLLDWAPGPGYGVTLPAAVLRDDLRDPVFGDAAGSAAYERQIREVLAIEARPVLAAGHFSVRVRRGGRMQRAGGVSWFRTDVGSYFGAVAPGRGGQDWATVAPADSARVVARLAEFAA
ncbi:MAG TPA: ESX secretion-associated protein EspG [Amycolatopsis sp.]|nr:ESX secretion-associated protein EspG [Amycolatopsis sp.]